MSRAPPDAQRVVALLQAAAHILQIACRDALRAQATLDELALDEPTLIALLMMAEPQIGWLPADALDGLGPQATLLQVAQRVIDRSRPLNQP